MTTWFLVMLSSHEELQVRGPETDSFDFLLSDCVYNETVPTTISCFALLLAGTLTASAEHRNNCGPIDPSRLLKPVQPDAETPPEICEMAPSAYLLMEVPLGMWVDKLETESVRLQACGRVLNHLRRAYEAPPTIMNYEVGNLREPS